MTRVREKTCLYDGQEMLQTAQGRSLCLLFTLFMASCVQAQDKTAIREKIKIYFPQDVALVERIIKCESNWNPNLISRTRDYGLMQINRIWWTKQEIKSGAWKDVDVNFKRALYVKSKQGFKAWVCWKKIHRKRRHK